MKTLVLALTLIISTQSFAAVKINKDGNYVSTYKKQTSKKNTVPCDEAINLALTLGKEACLRDASPRCEVLSVKIVDSRKSHSYWGNCTESGCEIVTLKSSCTAEVILGNNFNNTLAPKYFCTPGDLSDECHHI